MPGFVEDEERLVIGKGDGTNAELPNKADMDNVNSQMADIATIFINNYKFLASSNDWTSAINKAISDLPTNGGRIIFGNQRYNISGKISITKNNVSLEGVLSRDGLGGTQLFMTEDNLSDESLIEIVGTNNDTKRVLGGSLKNISILGAEYQRGNQFNDIASHPQRNNSAILNKDTSFFDFHNVFVYGFSHIGVNFDGAYDGFIENLDVQYCGTDGIYPSVNLTSTDSDCANALKFIGLHIEFTNYFLNLEHSSRHNQFIACKFEAGNNNLNTHSMITCDNTLENVFSACQFVYGNKNVPLFNCNYSHIALIGRCMLTSGGVIYDENNIGALFVYSRNGSIIIDSCIIDNIYADSYSFDIDSDSIFTNNHIFATPKNSTFNIVKINGNRTTISNNKIINVSNTNTITTGSLFYCTNSGNVIKNNSINGKYYKEYSADSAYLLYNIYKSFLSNISITYTTGATINSDHNSIILSYTNNEQINTISGGFNGQEITIISTNNNVTITNNNNIRTKGGTNLVMNANTPIKFFNVYGTWFEM